MKAPAEDAEARVELVDDRPARDLPSDVLPLPAGQARYTYAGGARPLSGYTIKRAVGRGGFGEVYYAQSDGGKEVALKLVRRNLDVELRGVAQCLNLKHPNLLGLYDIRTDQHDDHWVVMEYVAGPSLEQVIAAHPQGMSVDDAVTWLRGIAAGVAHLHDCGLVHRDLKPGNVFCEAGLVKIGDYGLSKFISCSRRSGQTDSIGTVHYMAPEVASGRYGREIDIYGLGIVFYEMLTGRVPFEGESVAEVLMKHLTAQPDLTGIAEPYRSVLAKALAKDPVQRFASVAEMMAEMPEAVGFQGTGFAHDGLVGREPLRVNPTPARQPTHIPVGAGPAAAATVFTPVRPSLWSLAAEEPIFRSVRKSLAGFGAAWKEQFSTPVKVVMILAAIWVVVMTGGALVPFGLAVGVVYSLYLAVWMILNWSDRDARGWPGPNGERNPGAPPVASTPVPPAPGAPPHASRRQRWHSRPRPALVVKPLRQRLAELCGSLVVSALASLVMTLVMFLLRGEDVTGKFAGQFAFVALVSIAGAWGVLLPAKFWEGTDGEPILRRFTMLVVGLLVGAAAWSVQQAFDVSLPHEFTSGPLSAPHRSPGSAAAPISVMSYLTYFGFLYLLIRWWKLADPLRSTRLSLWTTAVCVTGAMALYMFWPFPQRWDYFHQPWGFLVTGVIAIAVQLASPWQRKLKV